MNFKDVKKWTIGGQEVKVVTVGGQEIWKKEEGPKAFYVEDVSGVNNQLTLTKSSESAPAIALEYSDDNGATWKEWVNCQSVALPIKPNSRVYLRGTNEKFTNINSLNSNTINCIGNYNVGGDLTTLIVPNGNVLDLTGRDDCYSGLFKNSITLQNIKDLILPSTTLSNGCYSSMFFGCSNLQSVTELPAEKLAINCYNNMFSGCSTITNAPKLIATELSEACYCGIFKDCINLIVAPELPAMNTVKRCYENMFYNCKKLQTAPALLATKLSSNDGTLADSCYQGMFAFCTELINIPTELPADTLAPKCYQGMFEGCIKIQTAPKLYGTYLLDSCYRNMFKGCSSLNTVEVMATSWKTFDGKPISTYWLESVPSTGTFVKPTNLVVWDGTGTQPEGSIPLNSPNGIPEGWTVQDK